MVEARKGSFSEQVEKLASDAVSQSIGSIEYGVNAKATALMNPEVKKRIVAQLEKGFRLIQIAPLTGFGSSLMDFRVLFEFEPIDDDPKGRPAIDLEARSFVVGIELPTKAVRGIADYTPTPSNRPSDVPFSIAFPNQDASRVWSVAETAAGRERKAAYFRSLGFGGGAVDPSPIDDPWGGRPGGGRLPPGRGPVVITPGGRNPFADDGTTTYDRTPVDTEVSTDITTAVATETASDSISNNVTDDSMIDDPGTTDGTVTDDTISDGSKWDGDQGDNPHPDRATPSMFDRPFRRQW